MKHFYKKVFLTLSFLLAIVLIGKAQTLNTINPGTANISETITVTISGQNNAFGQGTSTTQVMLSSNGGMVNAEVVSIIDANNLTAEFTFDYTLQPGAYDVFTYNDISGYATIPAGFILNAPLAPFIITSATPNTANTSQLVSVSISGQSASFGQGTSTTNVMLSNGFSNIYPDNISISNVNSLVADFTINSNAAPGAYDVNVFNTIDGNATLTNGFNITANPNPPSLISATPNSSNRGTSINVAISGQNTHFGQGTATTHVYLQQGFNTIHAITTVSGATALTAKFPIPYNANTGMYDVHVVNNIDGDMIIGNGFTVNMNTVSPSITTVLPSGANAGQTIDVTISGQNTNFGQGTATTQVWFNQGSSTIYPAYVTVIGNNQLTAHLNIPNSAPIGLYTTNVHDNLDSTLSSVNSFTINPNPNPPALVNVNPDNGIQGQIISVTLSGQNTNFSQGTATVLFHQGSSTLNVISMNITDDTHITVDLDIPYNAALGYYDVSLDNFQDGTLSLPNGFSVNPNCAVDVYITQQACSGNPANIYIAGGTAPYNIVIDGQSDISFGNSYLFTPPNYGNYSINTVTDVNGCAAQIVDSIITSEPFAADFTTNASCEGTTANFASSIYAAGGILNYGYDFGDGVSANDSSHVYLNAGMYSATLYVNTNSGCHNTITHQVVINPKPQPYLVSKTDANCGLTNGAFEVSVTGGNPGYTYAVSGAAGYNSVSNVNTNLAPGGYNAIVTDANGCAGNINVLINNITSQTSISGVITDAGSSPAANSMVELLSIADTTGIMGVAVATISDATGNYGFANIAEGNYILAVNADLSVYPDAITTYYNQQSQWNLADTISVTCASQQTVNVSVIELAAGTGSAMISGTIIDVSGTHKTTNVGDPVPGVDVSLNSSSSCIAQTTSDANGMYSFANVEVGNYTIYVDLPGVGMAATYSINVTSAGQMFMNKNFYVDTLHSIDTSNIILTSVNNYPKVNAVNAIVYPNPFMNQSTVKYTLANNAFVNIEVYNVLGEKVATLENANKTAATHEAIFDAADFSKGIYYIKINTNGQSQVLKAISIE